MVTLEVSLSKGFMARVLGPVFDRDYYFDPIRRHQIDARCDQYARGELADLGACYTESNLGRRAYLSADQVLVGGIQPNMLLGLLLGAEFVPGADKDADISPRCLAGKGPADLPPPESLLEHDLVRLFDGELAAIAREGRLRPIPPLFWDTSGRPAVHGPLTTAQKLFGEDFLADLLADPEPCREILRWITRVNAVLLRHFAEQGRQAITEVHVGECAACMTGGDLFRAFVLPELSWMGQNVAPVRLHSCGTSNHLLDAFAEVANLSSLDLGGGTSLARVREKLGPRFPVGVAPLAVDLSRPTDEALLAWADRVLHENAGGPLGMVCHLEPDYPLAHLRALRRRIAAEAPGD